MTQILMPALSPTMEEGKLAKWLVKEGDTVKSGDILAEIETDKATMEFEAVDEGTIGKLLVAEGTEGVKVNQPIAEMTADGEDATAKPAEVSRSPLEGEPKSRSDFGGGGAAARKSPHPQPPKGA
jgi:pyruvate/2-oxoglutarate dehydrogenase complex dihydrolipoamide acyltransferase (E2) component